MRGPARLLRGWATALLATVFAAGSHTVAGLSADPSGAEALHGVAPSATVWVLTLALAGPLCTALAGRMLSWWRLLTTVGASQLLFHLAYSLAPAHPSRAPMAGTAPMLDPHAHHGADAALGTAGAVPPVVPEVLPGATGALSAAPDHSLTLAMLAAHAIAALLTVVVLRGADRAVLAAISWLVVDRPAGQLARWRPAVPTPVVPIAPAVGLRWRPAPALEILRMRGPPRVAVSF